MSAVTADAALPSPALRPRVTVAVGRTLGRAVEAHMALLRTRDALLTDAGPDVPPCAPRPPPAARHLPTPHPPQAAWHRPFMRALASPSPAMARLCHTAFARWLDSDPDAIPLRALADTFALTRTATLALAAITAGTALRGPVTLVELADALGVERGEPDGPPTRAAIVRQLLPGAPLVVLGLIQGAGPLAPVAPAPHLFEPAPGAPPMDLLAETGMRSPPLPPAAPDDPVDVLAAQLVAALRDGVTGDAWTRAIQTLASLDAALVMDCPGDLAVLRLVDAAAALAVDEAITGPSLTAVLGAALAGAPAATLDHWRRALVAGAREALAAGRPDAAHRLANEALRAATDACDRRLSAAAFALAATAAESSGAESPLRLWAACADAADERELRDFARARALPGFGALAAWRSM